MSYEELRWALGILKVPPLSTYKEIKAVYRASAKASHPDRAESECGVMSEVNRAYEIVSEYIESYRFYFTVEEFENQFPEERYARSFQP